MDYVKYVRSLIGHKPVILLGCVVLAFNEQGRVLLQKRKDNNLWSCPGGFMELDETAEQCAQREFQEETNQKIDNLTLFTILSGPDYYYEYPNQDKVYNVTIVFNGILHNNNIKANSESTTLQWFSLDKLPPLSPPTQKMFDKHQKNIKKIAQNLF